MDLNDMSLNTEHEFNGKIYRVTEFMGEEKEIFIKLTINEQTND